MSRADRPSALLVPCFVHHTLCWREMSQTTNRDLSWVLGDFVARVTGVQAALLASADGLKMAAAGVDDGRSDAMAAVLCGLHSLAKNGISHLGVEGAVDQVVVEHEQAYLIVMSADGMAPRGDVPVVGCLLGVLAKREDCDLGVIGHEMATLLGALQEYMVTGRRDAHLG